MTAKTLSEENHAVFMIRPDADAFDIASELETVLTQAKAIAYALGSIDEPITDNMVRHVGWALGDMLDTAQALSAAESRARRAESGKIRAA